MEALILVATEGGHARIGVMRALNRHVERVPAFDAAEWKKIAEEIENAILVGLPKVGRDFSFSSLPVPGSWCGSRSGVQILPPAPGTPSAHAAYPFVLEFPIVGAPDDDL